MAPLKDIRQKLLAAFQVEHRDHVDRIRSLLAMIGKTSGELAGSELDDVFRRAHSLKGAARAVDLRPVEGLAHHLETLFSRVRQGALPLDKDVTSVVLQALDAIEDCVAAMGESRLPAGLAPALHSIEGVLGIEPDPATAPEREIEQPIPAFQPIETMRVTAQNFDGLLRSAAGLLAETQRHAQFTTQFAGIVRQTRALEKDAAYARQLASAMLRRAEGHREFTRVTSRIDSLERQARALSRQAGGLRRLHQRSSWTIGRLSKQLQRDVWQARMVPTEGFVESYRKMMRDLASDESKEIEFHPISTNTHTDRAVLEALKDPIMHALRNAVSHGIEPPQERFAKGKPRAGLVTLRVGAEGQRLLVAIEDDGRGVDLARVADMAVKQGILAATDAGRASLHELSRILFRPGFSTSRSVTGLSGRGMGLSVVYEAVRRLQGDLDVQPRDGGGTILQLSVPLSISTHRLLLVSSGGRTFAVPTGAIERLHRIKLENVQTVEGNPVVLLSGQPVPLYGLQHLLKLGPGPAGTEPNILRALVLRSKDRRVAIAVDAFLRENDAVIQDLGPAAPVDGKISGGVLLDDGTTALVLNPMELLETSGSREFPSFSVETPEPAPEKEAPSILVVDDSMTTRTLERSILEAHGYRVRVAVDGMEALAQLRLENSDLVIADVQMPRMDGFELLGAIKSDQALQRTPVIMVTSLEKREDRERGLSLGADAYIVKRKFDQEELLGAIRQIL